MLTTKTGNVSVPILMNVDDRMGSCRDKGRMWGRVGAWCLSWWQRDPVGIAWSKQVAPQPGQAPGPLIHSTPPLVPTGRRRAFSLMTPFGCHNSSGCTWYTQNTLLIVQQQELYNEDRRQTP